MITSDGAATSPQVVIGDKLYRIKSDSIDIYDLKTKELTQNAIALDFAPVIKEKSKVPFTVCVYEGYKILIINGINANSEIGTGYKKAFTLTALSVNTTNNTVSKLSNLTFPWIGNEGGGSNTSYYTDILSNIINSRSIYDKHRILLYCICPTKSIGINSCVWDKGRATIFRVNKVGNFKQTYNSTVLANSHIRF